jgi:hypothetical protein
VTVYGYLHRGRIISADPATGGFNLQSVGLARTSRWGPVQSTVPGLAVGDRVILGATGTSRDELVIIAKVGATFPAIGNIPGLQVALDSKADDSEITTINNTLDDYGDLLGAHTALISGLGDDLDLAEERLDALEAPAHIRIVDDLGDIVTPYTDQVVWLTTARSFRRWDTAATPHRWSVSAIPGQIIGGKRRITNEDATTGTDELSVIDTGALNFEIGSDYEIRAVLLWQSSAAGDDFVFQVKETSTGGTQRAASIAPRTSGAYPNRFEISYLKAVGVSREDALSHIASAQLSFGTGTCTVLAGSYIIVKYLGPSSQLGTL